MFHYTWQILENFIIPYFIIPIYFKKIKEFSLLNCNKGMAKMRLRLRVEIMRGKILLNKLALTPRTPKLEYLGCI